MRLDLARLESRRQFIEDNLSFLRELASIEQSVFVSDKKSFYAAVHALQISIEAMLDMGGHVVARLHLGAPTNDREILEALREKGVISQEHFQHFIGMTRFRNKVVHGYIDVDASTVYKMIQNELSDFSLFFSDMKAVIEQERIRDAQDG